jgi:hypothetical protein
MKTLRDYPVDDRIRIVRYGNSNNTASIRRNGRIHHVSSTNGVGAAARALCKKVFGGSRMADEESRFSGPGVGGSDNVPPNVLEIIYYKFVFGEPTCP